MVILIIVGLIILYLIFSKGAIVPPPEPPPNPPEPVPDPDPHPGKWQLVDKTTQRWADYCAYMKKITTDTLMALELQKQVLIDGKWVKFYHWVSDWDLFHKLDYWDLPDEVWERGTADCLEENTIILIKDGIKKIKDLKIGDLVLSYNYEKEKYEYKKVAKIWDKRILDGYKIRLTNGHSLIATGDHRFYCRISEDFPKKYEIKSLKNIRLDYWCKRQLHCIHLLPEGDIDVDKNLAYLYGIYISEGYSREFSVHIAQDKKDIRTKIENVLNKLNVPYSKSKRDKNSSYNILKSEIKDKLKDLGTNSFDKKLPLEILNWNKESLRKLIEGMLDGDGTDCTNYKHNFKNHQIKNDLWEYSTSSEQVAKILNVIMRKVYGNCYYYKQLNHQGAGKEPIWRLRFNPYSLSNKREIYKGISTISISRNYLTKVKNKHFYDIEIEDDHNFILADSGVISHNCDGFARLVADVLGRFVMVILKLITEVHWLEYYGFYRQYTYNQETGEYSYKVVAGGHAICVYKKEGILLAFSNTSWWHDLNFQDYIEIGEQTFPEGLYWVIARHWCSGKMEWQMKAKENEIIEGTNIFHRKLRLIRNLKHLKRGERKKLIKQLEKGKC